MDPKVKERQNSKAMVSNNDLSRLGKVKNNPYTRFFLFLSPLCACVSFSWLLLSHVFVHAFIRLLDFIVLNGVNIMTKSTSVFQQPNYLQRKIRSFSFVILILWRVRFLCFLFLFFRFPLNLARFCFLLLMTLIICECLSICPLYCISEQHASSHTWESWNLLLLCLFLSFSLSLAFSFFIALFFSSFLLKKQVLKKNEMMTQTECISS